MRLNLGFTPATRELATKLAHQLKGEGQGLSR
jgi:hypothetical protein